MVRNMTLTMAAMFLAFTAGTVTQETLASTLESVSQEATTTSVDSTIVNGPTDVTLAATPTVVLASDVTTTTIEESAWANIKNGLWLILAGVVALVAVWWKKRKLAATPKS